MKCPKCGEDCYFLHETIESPFKMIVIKCGYCDVVISTMESVDVSADLLDIRNQLAEIDRKNQLIINLLEDIFNVEG